MKTGDIILSTGQSYVSFIVRTATQSAWSHAAVVVWMDKKRQVQLEAGPGRILCLLDIGGRPTHNVMTGKCTNALRIVKWTDALADYTCAGYVEMKPVVKRDQYFLARTRQFINQYTNDQMHFNQYRAFEAWWTNAEPDKLESTEVYCTELIAYYLKEVVWPCLQDRNISFPSGMIKPSTFTELITVYEYPNVVYSVKTVTAEEKVWLTWLLLLIVLVISISVVSKT